MKHAKLLLRLALSFGVAAFFVWLSLRKADLPHVALALRASLSRWPWLALYLVPLLLIHLMRTVRWGILLAPLEKVPFKRLNSASAIGFFALMVLPLRLGEFARPYLVASPRIRKSAAMASVVVERVVDGVVMALCLVVALLAVPDSDNAAKVRIGGYVMFGFFGGILVGLVGAYFLHDPTLRLIRAVLTPVSPKLAAKVTEMIDAFIGALKRLPSKWQVLWFFALTLAFWGTNVVGLMILARAFDFTLAPLAALTVLGAQVVGVMIPGGPGAVGSMQAFTQLGLSLFLSSEVVAGQGVAFANMNWLLSFGQQVVLGLVFLGLSGSKTSFGSLVRGAEGDSPPDAEGPAPEQRAG